MPKSEPVARPLRIQYPQYIREQPRPGWLRVDRLLGEWRLRWDDPGASEKFAAVMEARRQGEFEQEFKALERDWCFGSEQFRYIKGSLQSRKAACAKGPVSR